MGILKFAAKAVGTVALGAIGVSSHILNSAVNIMVGDDAPLFTEIEDGSFNTIRKIWNESQYNEDIDNGNIDNLSLQRRIDAKRHALALVNQTLQKCQIIQEKGHGSPEAEQNLQEKIDSLMDRKYSLLSDIDALEEELEEQKQQSN